LVKVSERESGAGLSDSARELLGLFMHFNGRSGVLPLTLLVTGQALLDRDMSLEASVLLNMGCYLLPKATTPPLAAVKKTRTKKAVHTQDMKTRTKKAVHTQERNGAVELKCQILHLRAALRSGRIHRVHDHLKPLLNAYPDSEAVALLTAAAPGRRRTIIRHVTRIISHDPTQGPMWALIAVQQMESNSYQLAASAAIIGCQLMPAEPLFPLIACAAYACHASGAKASRSSIRSDHMLKSLSFLFLYTHLRGVHMPESAFNCARLFHHMGMVYLAEPLYRLILSSPAGKLREPVNTALRSLLPGSHPFAHMLPPPDLETAASTVWIHAPEGVQPIQTTPGISAPIGYDYRNEAAHNLVQLYASVGSMSAALSVMDEWLRYD
ncbi:hypothetical protein KIPB_009653, partial [Kipferlia bialata]